MPEEVRKYEAGALPVQGPQAADGSVIQFMKATIRVVHPRSAPMLINKESLPAYEKAGWTRSSDQSGTRESDPIEGAVVLPEEELEGATADPVPAPPITPT